MTRSSFMMAWRLNHKHVLVVGGGNVAEGRIELVLNAGGRVTLVSPTITELIKGMVEDGSISWHEREVIQADLDNVDRVLVAMDDPTQSGVTGHWAKERRIPVNVADVPDECDFWFPASFSEGPIQVAISTNGQSPAGASRLKRFFRMALPTAARGAIERLGKWRAEQRRLVSSAATRMSSASRQARQAWVNAPGPLGEPIPGRVTLVGAGPGDPDLLTVAAIDALSAADLVVADRLVPKAITDMIECELRIARKWRGRADAAQDELNQWIVEGARAGKQVVRLKCGDPFLFGRGQEELDWLGDHGIESSMIPGVSSAFSAPSAAGIPVTSRGYADRVTVLTARGAGDVDVDLPTFESSQTYVWLMGMRTLPTMCKSLIETAGFPENLPAAIISRAHHPEQRAIRSSLGRIWEDAIAVGLPAPAVIVLGEVVTLAPSSYFELDAQVVGEVQVA